MGKPEERKEKSTTFGHQPHKYTNLEVLDQFQPFTRTTMQPLFIYTQHTFQARASTKRTITLTMKMAGRAWQCCPLSQPFSLCTRVLFRVSDACFTNHTMLEAQRIYIHTHTLSGGLKYCHSCARDVSLHDSEVIFQQSRLFSMYFISKEPQEVHGRTVWKSS